MHIRRLSSRLIAYAWAAPNTLLGLAVGLVMLCLGGRLHFVAGVAEFHGGWLGRIVAKAPQSVGFGAMTLGHAIVGIDQTTLCALRAHEHAHVRQFEAVGAVLFAGLRVVQFVASRQRPQRPRQQLF